MGLTRSDAWCNVDTNGQKVRGYIFIPLFDILIHLTETKPSFTRALMHSSDRDLCSRCLGIPRPSIRRYKTLFGITGSVTTNGRSSRPTRLDASDVPSCRPVLTGTRLPCDRDLYLITCPTCICTLGRVGKHLRGVQESQVPFY